MFYFTREVDGRYKAHVDQPEGDYITRHDFKTFGITEDIAECAGPEFIAIDRGKWTSPRYDIIKCPKVGDPVSYGFNGDSYPDGYIKSITKGTLRVITTDTGARYYRRGKNGGAWIKKGGTWSLLAGHHNERNPHI